MSSPAAPATLTLPGYAGLPGRYDEAVAPDGSVRPAWARFLHTLGPHPLATLRAAGDHARRAIIEQDISLNIYSGEGSSAAAWPLDAVPLLLDDADWDRLSDGLRQRARLFNHLLKDLYGPQRHLRSGALPAALAMANPHYLRACAELGKGKPPFLHLYAADVARSPDGRWWVLQDRLDTPAGLGYALQNRLVVRQALPSAFGQAPVRRLYGFARDLRSSLERLHNGSESPRLVLLSPGPANEAYYEHTYLARHLGCPLVEGGDLVARDHQVFLRTVGGLRRVDVILRRVDSDFCDPLELDSRSLLGVPGLVDAAQAGRVALSNQLGGRALEGTALLAFLAPLCRSVLGEDLRLPSAATWWAGQAPARDYLLSHLDSLVIKPAFGGRAPRYGALLSTAERAALADEILDRPGDWCGQERVLLGTTPVWHHPSDALRPSPFVMRVYLAWHDGDYRVMPGALTRFNPAGEDAIVSLQTGSVSKDTWILAAEPQAAGPAYPLPPTTPANRHGAATPSRLADTLYWLGRYQERVDWIARLLDKLASLVRDEITSLDPSVALDAARLVLAIQDAPPTTASTLEDLAALARAAAADRRLPGSLVSNLLRLSRNLEAAKIRLPPEAWDVARRLRTLGAEGASPLPSVVRTHLATLDGVLSDTVAHDTGWRFLQIGRRVERAHQLTFLLRGLLGGPAGSPSPGEFRLQTCLHLADSLFTYRATLPGALHPAGVAAWLVADSENPRGLRLQAEQLVHHLAALPDELAPRSVEDLRTAAFRLLSACRLSEPELAALDPASAATFARSLLDHLTDLHSRLGRIYFAHADAEPVA